MYLCENAGTMILVTMALFPASSRLFLPMRCIGRFKFPFHAKPLSRRKAAKKMLFATMFVAHKVRLRRRPRRVVLDPRLCSAKAPALVGLWCSLWLLRRCFDSSDVAGRCKIIGRRLEPSPSAPKDRLRLHHFSLPNTGGSSQ